MLSLPCDEQLTQHYKRCAVPPIVLEKNSKKVGRMLQCDDESDGVLAQKGEEL